MIRLLKIPEQFGSLYVCPAEHHAHHMQHEAAHILLRHGVQDYAQKQHITLREEHPLLSYQEYGKPYFADYPEIHFNLSHCDGLAACLISSHECGVDAEPRRTVRSKVVERVFSEEERQMLKKSDDPDWLFTRLWTLKEAYIKAIGKGLAFPMKTVTFRFEQEQIICNQKDAEFHQIFLSEHVISLCMLQECH